MTTTTPNTSDSNNLNPIIHTNQIINKLNNSNMNGHMNNNNNGTQQQQQSNILSKPSTTITRPSRNGPQEEEQPEQQGQQQLGDVVANNNDYVHQMGMARNSMNNMNNMNNMSNMKPDDYDPDSNVYVANLPSDYGKDRLYKLFATYGQIVRYKFVTPDEPTQPGYGFVQFAHRKDAHQAIKNLEGHVFTTGETIYLSIALRRRSSLSDEPTNLYVKNLPSSWTNDKLRKVFGTYGQIRQSKVVGDGIAFVRFEDHDQALNAIGRLDKQMVEQGCKLEVRFATRKTAANAYRLQQIPQTKTNENNLYIRNLPKYYNQSQLETLFANYGKISSAKINDNGIAFVRFAHAEDAKRAIQELNGKKPPQFEEEIVVKLAHFDIGDSRNRWANKFGGGGHQMNGHSNSTTPGGHFNNNMYQNHFNAPIGSMQQNTYGYTNNGTFHSHNQHQHVSNQQHVSHQQHVNHHHVNQHVNSHGPISSVPSSVNSHTSHSQSDGSHSHHNHSVNSHVSNNTSDVNVNVNMNNPLNASITPQNASLNVNNQAIGVNQHVNQNYLNLNTQMQAIQQQMQQFNIANQQQINNNTQGQNGNLVANQFAFPAATPVMMHAPQLFSNLQQQQQSQSQQLPNTNLPRQVSNDSHHSGSGGGGGVGSGAASPQSNHSGSSNDKAQTWSKKQQELGDQLYQKVHAKCGRNYAPKITGMLIKMGDKKAQQCIDDPGFLDQQIEIAKKLLETNEGLPQSNGTPNVLSPTSLLQQHSSSPTSTTPLINRLGVTQQQQLVTSPNNNIQNVNVNRFQQLNTKPVTPNTNPNMVTSPNTVTTPNQQQQQTTANTLQQQALLNPQLLTSSIPNLLTSSIPNSLYGAVPILSTPQLLAMSPAPASTTPQPVSGMMTANGTTATNGSHTPNTKPQYLFATLPNSNLFTNGGINGVVTSPGQHQLYTQHQIVTTPNSLEQQQQQAAALQQQTIQQSGWGLALQQNPQINVIQTQPQTQFMQPALYPKTQ